MHHPPFIASFVKRAICAAPVWMLLCATSPLRSETLSWNANPISDGVTAYRVYSATNGGSFTLYGQTAATSIWLGALPPASYAYRVTAVNAALLESAPSVSGTYVKAGVPPPACTYNVSPAPAQFPSSGGSATFTVSTQPACAWVITNVPAWCSLAAEAHIGSLTLTYAIAPTRGMGPRTATLQVAGQSYVITQAGRRKR